MRPDCGPTNCISGATFERATLTYMEVQLQNSSNFDPQPDPSLPVDVDVVFPAGVDFAHVEGAPDSRPPPYPPDTTSRLCPTAAPGSSSTSVRSTPPAAATRSTSGSTGPTPCSWDPPPRPTVSSLRRAPSSTPAHHFRSTSRTDPSPTHRSRRSRWAGATGERPGADDARQSERVLRELELVHRHGSDVHRRDDPGLHQLPGRPRLVLPAERHGGQPDQRRPDEPAPRRRPRPVRAVRRRDSPTLFPASTSKLPGLLVEDPGLGVGQAAPLDRRPRRWATSSLDKGTPNTLDNSIQVPPMTPISISQHRGTDPESVGAIAPVNGDAPA